MMRVIAMLALACTPRLAETGTAKTLDSFEEYTGDGQCAEVTTSAASWELALIEQFAMPSASPLGCDGAVMFRADSQRGFVGVLALLATFDNLDPSEDEEYIQTEWVDIFPDPDVFQEEDVYVFASGTCGGTSDELTVDIDHALVVEDCGTAFLWLSHHTQDSSDVLTRHVAVATAPLNSTSDGIAYVLGHRSTVSD